MCETRPAGFTEAGQPSKVGIRTWQCRDEGPRVDVGDDKGKCGPTIPKFEYLPRVLIVACHFVPLFSM